MNNKFILYHYDNTAKIFKQITDSPGIYNSEKGTPVFTPIFENLLDEALDELYVTIYGSSIKNYTPCDIFKIEYIENNITVKTDYYIVATDRADEYRAGSGKYKHELHLIEPTKLLEGVVCQSITFTNDLGNVYTNAATPAYMTIPEQADASGDWENFAYNDAKFNSYFKSPVISPVSIGYKLPSLNEMFNRAEYALVEYYKDTPYDDKEWVLAEVINHLSLNPIYSQIEITPAGGATTTVRSLSAMPELAAETTYTVSYTLAILGDANEAVDDGLVRITIKYVYTIYAVSNHYPLKPYSVTDMTVRCLELSEPRFMLNTGTKFIFDGVTYLRSFGTENPSGIRSITEGTQADKYSKVFGSEITLTQSTLREQLKSIGALIHAEPRLVISEKSGSNDLVYTVKYDEYGGVNIANMPQSYVSRRINRSINEYCTELRSNAKNLVNNLDYAGGSIIDPVAGAYRTTRTDTVNVRIAEGNAYAATAYPIYDIIKVECLIFDGNGIRIGPADITAYVCEKADYDIKSSYSAAYPISKSMYLYYTQGQKNINGLFYRAEANTTFTNAFNRYSIVNILSACLNLPASTIEGGANASNFNAAQIAFRITYVPIYNALIGHGKQKYSPGDNRFQKIYNQGGNLVEVRYFGENIKGAAARLGNVEEERTYLVGSITDLPNVGDMTNDGYSICGVRASFMPTHTKFVAALSKEFNRISQYVGIDSHKRIYEVSEREAYERNVLIKNYVVASRSQIDPSDFRLAQPTKFLLAFGNDSNLPQVSAVEFRTKSTDPSNRSIASGILPVISSALGNVITFTWEHKDNYSTGVYSQYATAGNVSGYWMTDLPYGDYFGRAYSYEFTLVRKITNANENEQRNIAAALPQFISDTTIDTAGISTDISGGYLLRKDSREDIGFTVAFEFKTTEDDMIIGSAFAATNPLVTSGVEQPLLFFVKNIKIDKFRQNIRDLYDYGEKSIKSEYLVHSGARSYTYESSNASISFRAPAKADAWVIVTPPKSVRRTYEDDFGDVTVVDDEEGLDILIASNRGFDAGDTETIYFTVQDDG